MSDTVVRTVQGRKAEIVLGSLWRRVTAGLIDCLLSVAILVPLTIALIWLMEGFHSQLGLSEFKSRMLTGSGVVLLWIIGHWLYCACAESSEHQATPGKRLLKLKVVSITHERVGFAQATWRHFAKFLSAFGLFAGFAMAIFQGRKQCLHDMIAGTIISRSE